MTPKPMSCAPSRMPKLSSERARVQVNGFVVTAPLHQLKHEVES
jgi:hypothetical protein